jgi:hypothetical protein
MVNVVAYIESSLIGYASSFPTKKEEGSQPNIQACDFSCTQWQSTFFASNVAEQFLIYFYLFPYRSTVAMTEA